MSRLGPSTFVPRRSSRTRALLPAREERSRSLNLLLLVRPTRSFALVVAAEKKQQLVAVGMEEEPQEDPPLLRFRFGDDASVRTQPWTPVCPSARRYGQFR